VSDSSLSTKELVAAYLARVDWRRSRAPGPAPRTRTLTLWERWIQNDPERAWELFEELVRVRPQDDEVLEQVWFRLQQLLATHGKAFEGRVRALVANTPRLRRIVPEHELDSRAHRPKPLDIPMLVGTYVRHCAQFEAHEINRIIRDDPVSGLKLALEIISRGPLHDFNSYDTMSPLLELLRRHGDAVIDEVEQAASQSVLVRRCLWRISRQQGHPPGQHDIAVQVWDRAERAIAGTTDFNCDDPPGIEHALTPEFERFIDAWFLYEETFWAWGKVNELIEQDPEPAWRVILHIIELSESDDQLGVVSAGPLEDLLSQHGEHFIERAEQLAASNRRFRECLGRVWQSTMSDELWRRVRLAAGNDLL